MAVENTAELVGVLRRRDRLGIVFARHAYGMRAWVDRFSARVATVPDPAAKALVATVVADNARHMLRFRERAAAHGVDPDAYVCPPEGEAIYARIDQLDALDELLGYALGSLDHFDELLGVYRAAAGVDELAAADEAAAAADARANADADALDEVRADIARMRATLRPLVGPAGELLAAEAHERYRVRELVETPRYAHAA